MLVANANSSIWKSDKNSSKKLKRRLVIDRERRRLEENFKARGYIEGNCDSVVIWEEGKSPGNREIGLIEIIMNLSSNFELKIMTFYLFKVSLIFPYARLYYRKSINASNWSNVNLVEKWENYSISNCRCLLNPPFCRTRKKQQRENCVLLHMLCFENE